MQWEMEGWDDFNQFTNENFEATPPPPEKKKKKNHEGQFPGTEHLTFHILKGMSSLQGPTKSPRDV